MDRSLRAQVGVGALLIVSLALVAYASIMLGSLRGFGEQLQASTLLPDAAGIQAGAIVKVAGVDVGTIDSIAVEDGQARLELSLSPDAGIRTDAIVQVRARSLLGEKFLAVIPAPGSDAPLLEEGGRLERVRGQTEIDELVNSLGPLVAGLDTDTVNELLSTLSQALRDDPEQIGRMLDDAESLLSSTATAAEDAPALVSEARATLTSVRRLSNDAHSLIARGSETLETIDSTAREAEALAGEARTAIATGEELLTDLSGEIEDIQLILDNLKEIDRWELRRLLREEGIVVRLRPSKVTPEE